MKMTIMEGWHDNELPYLLPKPSHDGAWGRVYSLREYIHLVCIQAAKQDDEWRLYTEATLDGVVSTLNQEAIDG